MTANKYISIAGFTIFLSKLNLNYTHQNCSTRILCFIPFYILAYYYFIL